MASGFLISLIILIVWVTNSELKAVDTSTSERSKKTPPNIIFILADDMGWNDVSFHGSDEIPTPNIDALGYNGVILNRHYVQPVCTPTRAALLTGKYPIHTGMQGNPILASEKRGLPLEEKTIAQHLKNLGYATHIVGKWHLGYYQTEYTPLQRGFDSHMGYYNGMISYYDHIMEDLGKYSSYSGYDFRRNYTTAWDCQGKYATDIFTEEAVNVIKQHNKREPLFMYLSHLAVHAGNEGKWLEAPQEVIDRFMHIPNPNRRTYAAMVSKLDDSVGKVMEALQSRHMLSNSIVVFLSDNGAPITDYFKNWGSNQPFRGEKGSLWESAVRTPAVVWSPLINKTSRVSKQLMHVTDWLPTLYAAAGGAEGDLGKELDGVNLWQTITQNRPSPRKELVVNIDEKVDSGAFIAKMKNEKSGKEETYKIILGKSKKGDFRFLEKTSYKPPYKIDDILSSLTNKAIKKVIDKSVNITQIEVLRNEATIMCERVKNAAQCNDVCLFNLENDPCEQTDLSQSNGMVLDYMRDLYNIQYKTVVPQLPSELDAGANPALFNYTWSSWVPSKIDLHTENGFVDKSIYNYHVLN